MAAGQRLPPQFPEPNRLPQPQEVPARAVLR